MERQLSSIDLRYLLDDIKAFEQAKIDKIFMPSYNDIVFRLYKESTKTHLRVFLPNIMYLATTIPPSPQIPSSKCMQLRKHLQGAKLTSIQQMGNERIVHLQLTKKDQKYDIYIELFGKGNLIIESEKKIIFAVSYKTWSDRSIKRHQAYEHPTAGTNPYAIEQKEFDTKITDEGVAKWLAKEMSIGGTYAQEICLALDIDQKTPANQVDTKALLEMCKKIISQKYHPHYVENKGDPFVIPFLLKKYEHIPHKQITTMSEGYDKILREHIHDQQEDQQVSGEQTKLNKVKKILHEQEQQKKGLEEQIKKNTEAGEYIFAHYQEIKDILENAKKLSKDPDFIAKAKEMGMSVNQKDKTISFNHE